MWLEMQKNHTENTPSLNWGNTNFLRKSIIQCNSCKIFGKKVQNDYSGN